MNAEELKARLRSLLHQRDMLAYERDSLELYDLIEYSGSKRPTKSVIRTICPHE